MRTATSTERATTVVVEPLGELCEAIRSALLYSVFAEEAGREGDPELQRFYRGLEAEEEERAERARNRLIHVLASKEEHGDAL